MICFVLVVHCVDSLRVLDSVTRTGPQDPRCTLEGYNIRPFRLCQLQYPSKLYTYVQLIVHVSYTQLRGYLSIADRLIARWSD